MSYQFSPSARVRKSPFYQSTIADGVVSFSPYNRMWMPTGYGDPIGEYWRLIDGVAMWDVAVERQIEIAGPDAARLVQILSPRKLDRLKPGVGWYVPICNHAGVLINDPILLKHSNERFWFSIADGDLLSWSRAVAAERRLDVSIFEADVSPLAIQGPKAEDVVAALLGEQVRSIRHFCFREMSLDGIPLVVARSGWSKQGGFELYLMDSSRGNELWQRVKDAGRPFDIGPGNPNPIERVESALLSWGGDTDDETNPFEVRLERFVDLDAPDEVIGIHALRAIHERGPARHQLGIFIDVDTPLSLSDEFCKVRINEWDVGRVTAQTWSPRVKRTIGLCLVSRLAKPGDTVQVLAPDGRQVDGELTELPFI